MPLCTALRTSRSVTGNWAIAPPARFLTQLPITQVLPDVHFEGFVSQESVNAATANNLEDPIKVFAGTGTNAPGCQESGALQTVAAAALPANVDRPGMAYRGGMRYQNAAGEWTYVSNGGHLGPLDCPEGMSKIRGHNVFSRQPVSVMSKSC